MFWKHEYMESEPCYPGHRHRYLGSKGIMLPCYFKWIQTLEAPTSASTRDFGKAESQDIFWSAKQKAPIWIINTLKYDTLSPIWLCGMILLGKPK